MREITLGGRRFGVIDFDRRTALNDDYLQKLIRATGADKIMPGEEEGDGDYLVRLQVCIIDSLRAHELVAGLLLPEGKVETDFDLGHAAEIAAHVARCNEPEDRAMVKELAVTAVIDFFREGLGWLKHSPMFSSAAAPSSAAAGTESAAPA